VEILRIRPLVWRIAQEVIPSEETAVDVFLCLSSLFVVTFLKSISQIVFFGAQLRHTTKSFVPSFLFDFVYTTVLEVATDVVLKFFFSCQTPDYSNSSS